MSTGTFTGRVNNRSPRLLADWFDRIDCDGFEFMVSDNFYADWADILKLYRRCGVPIKCVHADKHIGDLLSDPGADAGALFERNCRIAADLGVKKMVFHGWGIPDSDRYFEHICAGIGAALAVADAYGIEAVLENCLCTGGDPCGRLETLCGMYPRLGIVLDTRQAQFHRQLFKQLQSPIRARVKHIHINDYSGEYMQWDRLYPIPRLSTGDVDWDMFAAQIRGYNGTVTLEAPVMLPDRVDYAALNRDLAFVRTLFENKEARGEVYAKT